MSAYKFFHPMEVRYGDLDAQGHLNNAKYLTFFEQARVEYFTELGLFTKDQSFEDIGVVIADIHIKYEAPVFLGAQVKVGVRTVKIGNKSMALDQCIVDQTTNEVYASGTVILVGYDYRSRKTIPVPDLWRDKTTKYEAA